MAFYAVRYLAKQAPPDGPELSERSRSRLRRPTHAAGSDSDGIVNCKTDGHNLVYLMSVFSGSTWKCQVTVAAS